MWPLWLWLPAVSTLALGDGGVARAKRQALPVDRALVSFDGIVTPPSIAIPHQSRTDPPTGSSTSISTSTGGKYISPSEISQASIGQQLLADNDVKNSTTATSTAESLPATTPSKSCSPASPLGAIQCLVATSEEACRVKNQGCAGLQTRLNAVVDDTSICSGEVQAAAAECARCGRTAARDGSYSLYQSKCNQLGAISSKLATKLPPTVAASTTQIKITAGKEAPTSTSETSPSTGQAAPSLPATLVTAADAASLSQPLPTAPTVPPNNVLAAPKKVLVKIVSGDEAASISSAFERGNPPDETVTIQRQPSSIPVVPPGVASVDRVAGGGTPTDASPPVGPASTTENTAPIQPVPPSTTIGSSSEIKAVPLEYRLALDASILFFQPIIDPSCRQYDDGCEIWRTVLDLPPGEETCGTSILKSAVDCSTCVSAAGRSDSSTYIAQRKAYGWFKGNCSGVLSVPESDQKNPVPKPPSPLLSLESVEPEAPRPTSLTLTSVLDRVATATTVAQVQPVKAAQPVVKYVYTGTGQRTILEGGGMGLLVAAVAALVAAQV